MQYNLIDLADVIRSKNSGPFELTFDIIFKTQDMYKRVAAAGVINQADFAALYNIDPAHVLQIVHFDPAKAIKVTIVRPVTSGALSETDVYGAQQHAPLMRLSFELE